MFLTLVMKLLLLLLLLSFTSISSATDSDELINKAIKLNLSSKKYWKILLYYNGNKSVISSADFFIAKNGHYNPKNELKETIKAIFSPPYDNNSAICKFPARVKWLKRELNITDSDIPKVNCKAFKKYIKYLNPKSVSILFVSQSFISPESMFGHLALKIDRDNSDGLLSNGHVISYTASLGEKIFIINLMIKGVLGKFKGLFVLSSFDEFRENYNTFENRDIWEYSLKLSNDELETFMYHLWELKHINANYYFFSINCASIIEYMLKPAKPDIKLNNKFWTPPINIVDNLYKTGLLQNITFYSADTRKYETIMRRLDKKKRKEVYNIAYKNKDPNLIIRKYPEKEAANIISASQIKNTIRLLNGKINKEEYLRVFKNFNIPENFRNYDIKISLPYNPLNTHNLNRLDINQGHNSHGSYSYVGYSPLYHDVSDNPMGYPKNVNLRFLHSKLIHYNTQNRFGVEIDIVNLASFSPINGYIRKFSSEINVGFRSYYKHAAIEKRNNMFYLNWAKGISWRFSKNINSFCLLKLDGEMSNQRRKEYYLGSGFKSGFLMGNKTFFSTMAEFNYDYGYEGFYSENYYFKIKQSFFITRNLTLKINGEYNFKCDELDFNSGFSMYF